MRSLAIALALAAHAVSDFHVIPRLAPHEYVGIRLLTRAASPSFIFMFGLMLELVYARKIAERGFHAVVPRLLWRSLQCYFGYAATVITGWLMGLFDTAHFVQALFFIYGGHHGNILKYYAVMMLLAVVLLSFRHRFGILATVGVCLSIWLFDPVIELLTSFSVGRFNAIRELLLQMIPRSLAFVAAGMFVGNTLRGSWTSLSLTFSRHVGWVVGGCLLVISVLVWQNSPSLVLFDYLDYMEYRHTYHIGYYAIGLLQAVGLCYLLFLLLPPRSQGLSPKSPVLAFGRSSLLAFTIGNVTLNVLVGLGATDVSPYAGLGWTILFLAATLALVNGQEQLLQALRVHPTLSALFRPVDGLQKRWIQRLSRWLLTRGAVLLHRSASTALPFAHATDPPPPSQDE